MSILLAFGCLQLLQLLTECSDTKLLNQENARQFPKFYRDFIQNLVQAFLGFVGFSDV